MADEVEIKPGSYAIDVSASKLSYACLIKMLDLLSEGVSILETLQDFFPDITEKYVTATNNDPIPDDPIPDDPIPDDDYTITTTATELGLACGHEISSMQYDGGNWETIPSLTFTVTFNKDVSAVRFHNSSIMQARIDLSSDVWTVSSNGYKSGSESHTLVGNVLTVTVSGQECWGYQTWVDAGSPTISNTSSRWLIESYLTSDWSVDYTDSSDGMNVTVSTRLGMGITG